MSSRTWQVKYDPSNNNGYVAEDSKKKLRKLHGDSALGNETNTVDESKGLRTSAWILTLRQRLFTRWSLIGIIFVGFALMLYYSYLTSLYLVDEVYDGKGPLELDLQERVTLRVKAPKSGTRLADFIRDYSICPVVAEIQVLWTHTNPPPAQDSFVYSKTHCPVAFELVQDPVSSYATNLPTKTEGVLLLDVGIRVSCTDIAFAHSVWRSSKTALIGFFPRLHAAPLSDSSGVEAAQFQSYSYFGRFHVWWNSLYSIMLPAGVFADTKMLQQSGHSSALTSVLKENPNCYHVGLSVWAAFYTPGGMGSPPPMWVKVPATGIIDADSVSVDKHAECLEKLSKALNLRPEQQMRYSAAKSVRAREQLFW